MMRHSSQQQTLEVLASAVERIEADPHAGVVGSPEADELQVRLRQAALRLLSVRERSAGEMERRLREKGFPAEDVTVLVERFQELDLINDARFAHEWVQSRSRHSGRGRTVLRRELQEKGVDNALIDAELAQLSQEREEEAAWHIVSKRALRIPPDDLTSAVTLQQHRNRLMGVLLRRGFGVERAQRVVTHALAELTLSPDGDCGSDVAD